MESTQNVANPQLKSENFVLFPARRIAFENEESSTPNLISSLERGTYSSKRVVFCIFSFHFELEMVYLNRDRTEKQS